MAISMNVFQRPLDWIFSAPSHVAVLRALLDSREGMSGRAVARRAGVNHRSCDQALLKLERLKIIKRQGSGRTQLISLNFKHALVRNALAPLLHKEREIMAKVRSDVVEAFKSQVLSATLFGSLARGEAELGSDVDLLLIARPNLKEKIAGQARRFSDRFIRRYGFRLSPIVFTPDELRKRIKNSDPLIENIRREGIELLPRKMEDVIS